WTCCASGALSHWIARHNSFTLVCSSGWTIRPSSAMLYLSKQIDNSSNEVDMTPRTPMYRPVSRQLIRQLMRRTGDGGSVSVRQLAADAGLARSTVGGLLTGDQDSVPEAAARSLAQRLGVDLLVAF